MAYLKQINVFPIKSMQGISLSSAFVDMEGLALDRRLMLVNQRGQFITARKTPKLLAISCHIVADGLVLNTTKSPNLTVKYAEFLDKVEATIWRDNVIVKRAPERVNQWLSQQLNQVVYLVMLTEDCVRYREKLGQNISFADGHPLLLIGENSLNQLNQRASEESSMIQFRPNLVIADSAAFAEDCWHSIRIGEVEFELVKPCERCVMTTVDLTTLAFRASKEPLTTLAKFRADAKGRLMFGENLVAKNTGIISVGDDVEIVSTRTGIIYGKK